MDLGHSQIDRILVLRTVRFGESDLIVHGLNAQGQRLNLVAKGALKSKKRFGGGLLQATHYLEIRYKDKRSVEESTLFLLEDARLIEDFAGLRADYDRLQLAMHFLKIVSKVTKEGMVEEGEMFNLLGHGLRAASQTNQPSLLRLIFEIKFLRLQGVLPEDFPAPEELQWPLRDHENINWERSLIQQLQTQSQVTLHQYLE